MHTKYRLFQIACVNLRYRVQPVQPRSRHNMLNRFLVGKTIQSNWFFPTQLTLAPQYKLRIKILQLKLTIKMASLLLLRHSSRVQTCRQLFNVQQSFVIRSFHAKTSAKTSSFEEENGIEFNQNHRFFESKKMGELARALFVLKFSSYEFLVKNSLPVSIRSIPKERFWIISSHSIIRCVIIFTFH